MKKETTAALLPKPGITKQDHCLSTTRFHDFPPLLALYFLLFHMHGTGWGSRGWGSSQLCSGWVKATCSALLPGKELNKGLPAAALLWRSIFQHNPAATHNLLWQLGPTAPGKLKRWFGVFFYLFSGVDQTKLSWPKIEFGLDSKEILLTTYCLILLFLWFIITNLANIYIYCDER